MGQLAKQLAEKPNGQFVANTEKNPKEECKVIFTKSKVKESLERNKNVEGEGKEVEKDEEDDERQIKETEKRILEEKKKNTNEDSDEVLNSKTKSQLAIEGKKEVPTVPTRIFLIL